MEFQFRKNVVIKHGPDLAKINLWHIPYVLERLGRAVETKLNTMSSQVSSYDINEEDRKWLITLLIGLGRVGNLKPFLQTEINKQIDPEHDLDSCEISISDEYPFGTGGFYRFHPLNDHFLNNLFSRQLKFSNPLTYNDPFEANYIGEKFEWEKLKNEEIGFSTCCFSTEVENVLMWSHYADSHKGVCLEFDLKLHLIIDEKAKKVPKLYPVMYFDEAPVYPSNHEAFICTSKSNFWSYEKEVRLVLPSTPPGFYEFNPSHLTSIILGCECTGEDMRVVKELMGPFKNAKLKRVVRKRGVYKLEIKDA
ncbi:MAG: hypothetical protein JWO30_2021 [Fibrobacteres bacterium]|nr:hypothetical protein [Fibrobacterota bacterium]